MARYYIRPTFDHMGFETREEAINHVKNIPAYRNLKYWVASDTAGIWHIYCDKGLYIQQENLASFPKPYITILKDYAS